MIREFSQLGSWRPGYGLAESRMVQGRRWCKKQSGLQLESLCLSIDAKSDFSPGLDIPRVEGFRRCA